MVGVLKAEGYEVVTASDGNEAIDIIKARHIDLGLIDINMAPTGGFEFIQYAKSEGYEHIPMAVITGDQSSDILTKASALGVAQLLQKPVEPGRLVQSVKRILDRYGPKKKSL